MLPEGAIHSHRLWKRFRADQRRRLLRDEIARLQARLRGVPGKGWRWALRDVTFSAEPGESVGLVGANGSGKSTLLKILARVMYPYAGRVEVGGRVGALIEVRSGIHPDLTGRENVFLYGSLLGLGRRGVARRFDEIVEFAELDDAIDRQVKFYSSGMQMRLGFAVAAFLEPDVLLVDEVLAVGDASFQQRCLERMRHVLEQGTTLVFVSHDLTSVEAMCTRGLWLRDGSINADGEVREVLSRYRASVEEQAEEMPRISALERVVKAEVTGPNGEPPASDQPLELKLVLDGPGGLARACIGVSEGPATPIFIGQRDFALPPGEVAVRCTFERLPLPRGRFYVWCALFSRHGIDDLLPWHPVARFDVAGPGLDPAPTGIVRLAPIQVGTRWSVEGRS